MIVEVEEVVVVEVVVFGVIVEVVVVVVLEVVTIVEIVVVMEVVEVTVVEVIVEVLLLELMVLLVLEVLLGLLVLEVLLLEELELLVLPRADCFSTRNRSHQSQPQLLPAPAPHTEVTRSLTKHREPETRASTTVRAHRVARPRPPAVRGTNGMTLRPSSVPQRIVLPEPPVSCLPHVRDPESDLARAASPTVTRLLATVVTDPYFVLLSTAAFALVIELVDFAARSRLDYVASLITDSESVCPPSVRGEPALRIDILEDRQFEL
ncbi:unnamed protein product [Closterium sp. NIES-54]